MIALLLAAALLPPVAASPPPDNSRDAGRTAYVQHCATCHGSDLGGGPNGPSLRGVGVADIDFWVGTGRMPAAVPWIQVDHRGPQLPQTTIAAIEAYVARTSPGGTAIPLVSTGGDAARGRELFRSNCMHCHGADAEGASIGGAAWAPSLARASVTQIGEAIRLGPGNMPRFGERQLPLGDVDDIVTYLAKTRAEAARPAIPLPTSGPVPEGLLGWLAAALLAVAAAAFSSLEPPKEGNT